MECDGRRAEGLNGPRPGPTFEPPADAVSWCWAERRDCLPGGRGRTIPPEKPKVVEFGGGLLDQLVYSWKVNCKIVVVIILAFGRLIFRLSSQRTAHCNAKAGNWHYVRREETQIATVASAGWLSPPTPPPTPFFSWRGFVGRGLRHWVLLQSGTAGLHAKGRCWLCSGNSWSRFREPQPWATTRCPPWRAP